MPSFDTVIQPDLVELRNAVEQANKEIGTRFDFKGTDAKVSLREAIIAANNTAGTDTISFNMSSGAGTYGEFTILNANPVLDQTFGAKWLLRCNPGRHVLRRKQPLRQLCSPQ